MNELKLEYLKLKKKTRSWLGPILVFWLIMLAFPLTVEFMQDKLEIGFFSVLWIAILISMMLATEDIFIEDYNDGSLEQTIIKNTSFQFLISIRIVVYWLMIGVPISILSFIFSIEINFFEVIVNILFTFLFYFVFARIFNYLKPMSI